MLASSADDLGETRPLPDNAFDTVAADGHVVSIVEEPATYPLNLWDEHTSPMVLRSVSYHFVQLAAAQVTYDGCCEAPVPVHFVKKSSSVKAV